MTKSGSKYSAMTEAMREKIGILSDGIDDNIRQRQIEAEMGRIDADVERECEEIRNTPVDTELVVKQAESDYKASLNSHKRQAVEMVQQVEDTITQLKHRLTVAERQLEETKAHAKQQEEQANLKALADLDNTKASVGNKEKTIELRIKKAKLEGERRKANLQAELDNITAKTEAHADKLKCVEQLYDDLKEISLKLGDAGK